MARTCWLPDPGSDADQNFPECFQAVLSLAPGPAGHHAAAGGSSSQVASAGRGCGGSEWSPGEQVTQQVEEHHGAGQVLREGRGRVQQTGQQERKPPSVSIRQQEQHGGDVDVAAGETWLKNRCGLEEI